MPVSSLEMATTAALWRATRGRTRSSTSSSPVTELMRGLPSYTEMPASSASTIEESMDRGTSVTLCTSLTACASRAGSSASGIPALTSSNVGAGGGLGQCVGLDPAEVAVAHLLGQQGAARWG